MDHDARTGLVDLDALEAALDSDTAAFYFENPGFLGVIETRGGDIARKDP